MNTKICKHCGTSFEPFKNAKGFYCSYSCYFGHKKQNAGYIAKERVDKILELYKRGLFINPIACEVGTTFYVVKDVLQKAGVFDASRIRPQHVKGNKRISINRLGERLIVEQYKDAAKKLKRFDESKHWKNHPEATRWAFNKTAKSQYYKWRSCPAILIKRRLRSRINRVLKGKLKSAPTLVLLGCSLEQFKSHLESRFTRGMSWRNYGSGWHLDHKEPCSSFDLSNPEEQRRCFHYSNLQPLWAKVNRCKHARIIPTQRELLINLNEPKRSAIQSPFDKL
ncbi:MAG: hypothetical protein NTZ16_04565 [Verrucomicrobia bacterium]|nr:hypothetical protein [Verrucomicrobiota bacterium]